MLQVLGGTQCYSETGTWPALVVAKPIGVPLDFLQSEARSGRRSPLELHAIISIASQVTTALAQLHACNLTHASLQLSSCIVSSAATVTLLDDYMPAIDKPRPPGPPPAHRTPTCDIWDLGLLMLSLVLPADAALQVVGSYLDNSSGDAPLSGPSELHAHALFPCISQCLARLPDQRPAAARVADHVRMLQTPQRAHPSPCYYCCCYFAASFCCCAAAAVVVLFLLLCCCCCCHCAATFLCVCCCCCAAASAAAIVLLLFFAETYALLTSWSLTARR